jgi:hypothetical protein
MLHLYSLQKPMDDPVVAEDGYTYDRAAIAAWLISHNTSPMNGAELPSKLVGADAQVYVADAARAVRILTAAAILAYDWQVQTLLLLLHMLCCAC